LLYETDRGAFILHVNKILMKQESQTLEFTFEGRNMRILGYIRLNITICFNTDPVPTIAVILYALHC
jgi:hypothetical protein